MIKGTSGNLNSAHRAFTDPIGKPLELKKSRYTPPGWTKKSLFFSPLTKLPGKSPLSRGALKNKIKIKGTSNNPVFSDFPIDGLVE